MKFEAELETAKPSECRALVPLTVTGEVTIRGRHVANAAFIAQLSANVKGFAQYRAKRRVNPETGALRYRTTIADALACQPNGRKLNYCA